MQMLPFVRMGSPSALFLRRIPRARWRILVKGGEVLLWRISRFSLYAEALGISSASAYSETLWRCVAALLIACC